MGIGLWAAVAAVIIDSVVTIFMCQKLIKTAEREAGKAAETLKPALKQEIENAALVLIPLIVDQLKSLTEHKGSSSAAIGAIHSIGNRSATDNS